MSKPAKSNEDWIKRGEGRIPTKGAMAAERASAGLGTSDDEETLLRDPSPLLTVWGKQTQKARTT